jgi:hypothetical protein
MTIGSLLLVGFATATNQNQDLRPGQMPFDVQCKGVTISNGYYNISVSVNAMQSAGIQKIIINPGDLEGEQAIEEISGLNTYLNGTAVNMVQALSDQIRSGDYLQVNFIMPYTAAYQNQMFFVIQATNPYCLEMQTLNLTRTPSEPI